MIESYYWKEELLRIAKTLKRVKNPRRWSERAHCVVERDIMIGFFILRRLIELYKVSSAIRDKQLQVYSHRSTGNPATFLNSHDIWELYDLETEKSETKKPSYMANQFIHAYTSFVWRDDSRNWSDVLIVSDYDKNDRIWRVPVATIRDLFIEASQDYPSYGQYVYDPKKKDYHITTD